MRVRSAAATRARELCAARRARRLGARPAPVGSATRPSYGQLQRDVFATSYYASKQATEASAQQQLRRRRRRDVNDSGSKTLANCINQTNRSSEKFRGSRKARETAPFNPKAALRAGQHASQRSPSEHKASLKIESLQPRCHLNAIDAAHLPSQAARPRINLCSASH